MSSLSWKPCKLMATVVLSTVIFSHPLLFIYTSPQNQGDASLSQYQQVILQLQYLSLVLYHIVQNPFFYMWVKTSHSAMKEWHPGPVTLQVKSKVHLKALQASESTAPQALTGYGWMALLHVRGVLIPTLNELANGSPFTLTPFPHTFTHQALLAYPLGHRRQGRTAWLAISLIAWP